MHMYDSNESMKYVNARRLIQWYITAKTHYKDKWELKLSSLSNILVKNLSKVCLHPGKRCRYLANLQVWTVPFILIPMRYMR